MGLNRDLKLLSLSLFLWALGEGLFIFIFPIYLTQEFGADSVQIGTIYSVGAAIMAVSLIPAGWATDKFGPKGGLVSGWFFGIFAAVFFAIAHDIWIFMIGWALYRATAWVIPAISTYATNARGDLPPERAISSIYSMFHAGLIISPTIGGYIGSYFGLRANFYIAAVMFIISTIVITLLHHQPPHPVEHRARPAELLGNRAFLGFMALVFTIMVVVYLGYDFAPKFMSEVKQVSLEQIGWLGTVNAIGGFTLNQYLGRRPPRRGLIAALGLILIHGVVLLQASWFGWFALGYYMRGANNTARALIAALTTRIVKPAQLGMAFGFVETVATSSEIVAPYAAGWFYTFSPQLPFIVMVALCPVIMILVWLFAPRGAAQAQPAPTPIKVE